MTAEVFLVLRPVVSLHYARGFWWAVLGGSECSPHIDFRLLLYDVITHENNEDEAHNYYDRDYLPFQNGDDRSIN